MRVVPRYLLVLCLGFLCLPAQAAENSHFEFSGEVMRGQEYYSHDLPDGLTFSLIPTAEGWEIRVQEAPYEAKLKQLHNLADITLPMHGPNPIDIEGWNLRNSDNTGANEPGSKNLNVWGEERDFRFALSEDDHQAVFSYIDCMQESSAKSECEKQHLQPKRLGYGTLVITDYKLGNLVPKQRAWFESMKFTFSGDYKPPQD